MTIITKRRLRTVERYTRPTRWYHAAIYLTVLALQGTGWRLLTGREGDPSPAARLTGVPDITLHTYAGWGLTVGARATRTFVQETVRVDRGDLRWFIRWPAAMITGRFAHHRGQFDPGQRVANVVLVALLAALVASGVGLTIVVGGPGFVWLQRVHRRATYLITPVLAGHILIAAGSPTTNTIAAARGRSSRGCVSGKAFTSDTDPRLGAVRGPCCRTSRRGGRRGAPGGSRRDRGSTPTLRSPPGTPRPRGPACP
jgi:cytochrome b subunit of formate dehydrogenase